MLLIFLTEVIRENYINSSQNVVKTTKVQKSFMMKTT